MISRLLIPVVMLSACASVDSAIDSTARTTQSAATAVAGAITREEAPQRLNDVGRPDDLGDAIMTNVKDLNLRKVDVPMALLAIRRPYDEPPKGCAAIVKEIHVLDEALGPDYDRLPLPQMDSQMQRTGLGLIGSAIGGLMPFRSVVREVSGASARERELRDYYRVGIVRRGFLRGLARERGC